MNFELVERGPKEMTVRARCEALDISEQGYYAYCIRKTEPSSRAKADACIADAIAVAHAVGRESYGTPRLKVELVAHGICTSRRRITRLRAALGLSVHTRRKFVCTTREDTSLKASPNLLNRDFVASGRNRLWVSDITFLTAGDDWLYLCTIIDCYSGAVVGRKLSRAIDTQLVRDTFAMAVRTRRPEPGCIFHSDRGSQYASTAFRDDLAASGFIQSMSRRANCWDNAVAESSFGRLKTEIGDTFVDEVQARNSVYDYLDVFYNRIRIHSRHNKAPLKFELSQASN